MKEEVSFEVSNYLGVLIFNMHGAQPRTLLYLLYGGALISTMLRMKQLLVNVNARGYMLRHVSPIRIN